MNTLNMPGFNAEAVFYRTSNHYRLTAGGANTGEQVVIPQMPKWFRCGMAVLGAGAACSLTALSGPIGLAACAAATAAATAVCE